MASPADARLMRPGEVAEIFRVDPKTVTRWAKRGKIRSLKTPGGHVRIWAPDVSVILGGGTAPRGAPPVDERLEDGGV